MKDELKAMFSKVKPLEAALFALLGYKISDFFSGTGISGAIYSLSPQFKAAVDGVYASNPAATKGQGAKLIAGGIGAGALGKVLYDGFAGTITTRDLSTLIPYVLGVAFDPETAASGSTMGPGLGAAPSRWN